MATTIVNLDISYYLLQWLLLEDIISLSRTNNCLYQMVQTTPLYNEILLLRGAEKPDLHTCYCKGYLLILNKLRHRVCWSKGASLAALAGKTEVLYWLLSTNIEVNYSENVLNNAALNGHINVFQWFETVCLPLKYTHLAVDWAAKGGHLNLIQWLYHSGLEFKYSELAVDWAAGEGHVEVIDWFWNIGLPFKYTKMAFGNAQRGKKENVILWFTSHGLTMKRVACETINPRFAKRLCYD